MVLEVAYFSGNTYVSWNAMSDFFSNNFFKDRQGFKNETLAIDTEISNIGIGNFIFEECTFRISKKGALLLRDCTIKNCKFEGLENLHFSDTNRGFIDFQNCKTFYSNTFDGEFRRIKIVNGEIKNLTDNSVSTEFSIVNTEIEDFSILTRPN